MIKSGGPVVQLRSIMTALALCSPERTLPRRDGKLVVERCSHCLRLNPLSISEARGQASFQRSERLRLPVYTYNTARTRNGWSTVKLADVFCVVFNDVFELEHFDSREDEKRRNRSE
jgi:hypothetical protein